MATTIKEFERERAQARRVVEEVDNSLATFGLTSGNAIKSMGAHREASSPEPTNVAQNIPLHAYGAAVELLETVLGDGEQYDIVNEAVVEAETPQDFWEKVEDSLEEPAPRMPEVT